jgi:hypothetical protein
MQPKDLRNIKLFYPITPNICCIIARITAPMELISHLTAATDAGFSNYSLKCSIDLGITPNPTPPTTKMHRIYF